MNFETNNLGFTLWLTGLPCSGKSTLALALADLFRSQGKRVEILDGDVIRKTLSQELGFSKKDRDIQIERVGFLAHLLTRNDVVTLVATISPYREAREANRKLIQRFTEVYVRCPVEVCIQRDCKGMYRKAMEGKLPGFTGISDPYEEPEHPEIIVDTDANSENDCIQQILRRLVELGVVSDVLTTPAGKPT